MARHRLVPQAAMAALVPLPAFAQDAAQQSAQAAPATPVAIWLFMLFVAALAFGLGRYAWQLRRDYIHLIGSAPREPGATTDRLALLRDSPGGLPDGTIRAALAIAIVMLTIPAIVLSRQLGLSSTGELGTILGGVLGFYFGTRTGGAETDAARRQADASLKQAQAAQEEKQQAQADATAARDAQLQAEAEAARQAQAAEGAAAGAREQAKATGEAATRLAQLAQRAAEGVAAARAIAALLPAGPAATAITQATTTAGAVLAEAGKATAAIQAALADPSTARVQDAVSAASAVLKSAGEGTEVAERLRAALDVVREATGAIGKVRDAVADPTPESIAAAMAEAARIVETRADGGLGGALAPALGVLGSVMRTPALLGTLGAPTPVGLAAAVALGAWQAAALGRAHYLRWMARVLDRPVSRDLFPGGEWDGEAARALIAENAPLAAALAARLSPDAPQSAAAEALSRLLEPEAGAWLCEQAPRAFASVEEADAAVAALRRRVLEAELDRLDSAPVRLGDDLAVSQGRLRDDLDRLREAGAGGAIDTLALLADGIIAARPEVPGSGAAGFDVPALLRRAVAAAAEPARALERPTPAPMPVGEGDL